MYKLQLILITFIPLYMFAQAPKFIAPKNSKILSIHGHNRFDDYYWMNERDSKAVLENLKQENEVGSNSNENSFYNIFCFYFLNG